MDAKWHLFFNLVIYMEIGESMRLIKKYRWIGIGCTVLLLCTLCMRVAAEQTKEYAPLSGVTIVLDAGHGGKDQGAQVENVKEQEINLLITQKLKAKLEGAGASVTLTRDGAYDLASEGASNRKKEDMKNRATIINQKESDIFISIHLNSYPNTSIQGAHAFYRKGDPASEQLAQILQAHFNLLTGLDKDAKAGDYYLLNQTEIPGVLVECGFVSNAEERSKLVTDAYQEQIADVLYEGVLEYLGALNLY